MGKKYVCAHDITFFVHILWCLLSQNARWCLELIHPCYTISWPFPETLIILLLTGSAESDSDIQKFPGRIQAALGYAQSGNENKQI